MERGLTPVQVLQLVLPLIRRAGPPTNGPYRRLVRGLVADASEALVAHDEEGDTPGTQESGQGRNGYGALEQSQAPRVEPSGLVEDRPNWGS